MARLLWGTLVNDLLHEQVQHRGDDTVLRDLRKHETLCVAGRVVGGGDLVLYAGEGAWEQFAGALHELITRLVDQHGAILAGLDDDRFLALFPAGGQLLTKPVGSGFEFVTALDHESPALFEAVRHKLAHHPVDEDGTPRDYGLSIGVDLGPVSWTLRDGKLVVAGEAITWARRCSQGQAGEVIVNNGLRWRMADSQSLEPRSAVALYAHHILFREQVATSDGVTFRAYQLARRK